MGPRHGGQVHHQPSPCLAQPARDQADFFQKVADLFWAIDETLATGLSNAIDLGRDLADKELIFAFVAQVKRRLHRGGLEAGRAVSLPLLLNPAWASTTIKRRSRVKCPQIAQLSLPWDANLPPIRRLQMVLGRLMAWSASPEAVTKLVTRDQFPGSEISRNWQA